MISVNSSGASWTCDSGNPTYIVSDAAWIAVAGASWICSDPSKFSVGDPTTYKTIVTIDGGDSLGLSLGFKLAADDKVTDVLVNGVSTGFTHNPHGPGVEPYNTLGSGTLSGFHEGSNTVEVVVDNGGGSISGLIFIWDPIIGAGSCNPLYYTPLHLYKMDEVGITTVAIDSAPSNQKNGTYSGTVTYGVGGAANDGGTGVLFNGGYITIPQSAVNTLTSTTISFWCIWNGGPSWQRAFDFNRGTMGENSGAYYFFTPENGESGLPRFGISLSGRNNDVIVDGLRAFPVGRRVFVTCTWSGHVARLYIDGVLQGSVGTAITLAAVNPANCYIGFSPWNANEYFRGVLDNFTIYDRVLSAEEIKKISTCRPVLTPTDRDFADEMIISDKIQVKMVWNRGLSDSVNISDLKGSKRALSDSITLGETLKPTSRLIPQAKDDLAVFDYAQVQAGLISQRTDALIFKETVSAYKTLPLSDTLLFNDVAAFPFLKIAALKNTLAINDTLSFKIPGKYYQYVSDSISFLETITRSSNRYTLKDSLFIIDGVLETGVPERQSLKETVSLSDGVKTNLFLVSYKDTLSFSDKARGNLFRMKMTDSLDIRETLKVSPYKISLSDSFVLSDVATFITNHPYVRDDLTLTEVLKFRLSIINKRLVDTLTIMEKLQYRPNPVRLLDSLTLTDQVNRVFPRSFVDTLALVDTARRFFGNAFVDTLTLNETLLARPSKKLQDALTILDLLCCSYKGQRTITDTLSLQQYLTYTLNDVTTPPAVGDDGWYFNAVYDLLIGDELDLRDRIISPTEPLCGAV